MSRESSDVISGCDQGGFIAVVGTESGLGCILKVAVLKLFYELVVDGLFKDFGGEREKGDGPVVL